MAEVVLNALVKQKRSTTAEWERDNPVLPIGVFGIEITEDGKNKLKAGDGETAWNDLEYLSGGGSGVITLTYEAYVSLYDAGELDPDSSYEVPLTEEEYQTLVDTNRIPSMESGLIVHFYTEGEEIVPIIPTVGGGYSMNLLANSNFMVNQRGKSVYDGINGGCYVDRWKLEVAKLDATVKMTVLNKGGIRLENEDSSINFYGVYQYLEVPLNVGEVYTVSVNIDGNIYNANITGGTRTATGVTLSEDKNIKMYYVYSEKYDCEELHIRFYTDFVTSAEIKWVKLEIGSTFTSYVAPDPWDELVKCGVPDDNNFLGYAPKVANADKLDGYDYKEWFLHSVAETINKNVSNIIELPNGKWAFSEGSSMFSDYPKFLSDAGYNYGNIIIDQVPNFINTDWCTGSIIATTNDARNLRIVDFWRSPNNENPNNTVFVERVLSNSNVNENLLFNPDFKINQKETTEYNVTGYTLDRWIFYANNNDKLQVVPDGVKVIATDSNVYRPYISQLIDRSLIKDGVYTMSISIDGVVYSGTGVFNGSQSGVSALVPDMQVGINYVDEASVYRVFIQTSITKPSFTVNWVKLEAGYVATKFMVPDPALELAKCQRYFKYIRPAKLNATAYNAATNTLTFTINDCIGDMRTVPTVIVKGIQATHEDVTVNGLDGKMWIEINGNAVDSAHKSAGTTYKAFAVQRSIDIDATVPTSVTTLTGIGHTLAFSTNTGIMCDAEVYL